MQALEAALKAGVVVVTPDSYPSLLVQVPSPPPALFAWGEWACLAAPTVAIVGTRHASAYGRATAQKFAEELARAGVTIVSGGAIGIDAAAHKGALQAGGKTTAVFGTGIDGVYPALHRGLFEQIRANGCLVSQFAVGSRSHRQHFLVRNSLVAALSRAVLVVEAPFASGSINTAHAANELGRQVFVVPATIDHENFRGSHDLIRAGATLVDHPNQILDDLGIPRASSAPAPLSQASEIQQKILAQMTVAPLAAEFIAERTGIDPAEVMSELTMLELEGRILRDAGGYALKP
ncbi:MAG: DNA-processing protein DprA [Fimbriimonadaceae bacterium]